MKNNDDLMMPRPVRDSQSEMAEIVLTRNPGWARHRASQSSSAQGHRVGARGFASLGSTIRPFPTANPHRSGHHQVVVVFIVALETLAIEVRTCGLERAQHIRFQIASRPFAERGHRDAKRAIDR